MFIVYMATNTVNGKRYIGITTKVLHKRQNQHYQAATAGSWRPFHAALRKYGRASFVWKILEEHDTHADLVAAEVRLIAAVGAEYNVTKGGDGVVGLRHSDESRAKMRAAQTPEARAHLSALRKGKKMSPESVRRMKEAQTPERIASLVAFWTGRKHRPETIEKMRESQTGRPGYWKGKNLPDHVRRRFVEWAATPEQQEKWKGYGKLGSMAIQRKVICIDDGTTHESVRLAARAYGLSEKSVCHVCRGINKTAGSLSFAYADGGTPEAVVRPKGKMTPEQVLLVRRASEYGASRAHLAWAYDRSYATITRIISNKTFPELGRR